MSLKSIVFSLICMLSANAALAHSKMAQSTPVEGSTVQAGLAKVTLGFSKPVRLMLVKVKNTSLSSNVKAEFTPASNYQTSFPFEVAPLSIGQHEITWTAVAEDGHVMKGTLSFKVAE